MRFRILESVLNEVPRIVQRADLVNYLVLERKYGRDSALFVRFLWSMLLKLEEDLREVLLIGPRTI
jgi:hypothetical protein